MSSLLFVAFLPPRPFPRRGVRVPSRLCPSRPCDVVRVGPVSQAGGSEPEPESPRENNLLSRLDAIPDPATPSPRAQRLIESPGRVRELFTYLSGPLGEDIERALAGPVTLISAAVISILFGFFSATSASTIIGSVADWDPLAAAVLLIWTEGFTKYYYKLDTKSRLLQLINAFKIGLIYGMTVDAFKLST